MNLLCSIPYKLHLHRKDFERKEKDQEANKLLEYFLIIKKTFNDENKAYVSVSHSNVQTDHQ
jgi:hypothetical protein